MMNQERMHFHVNDLHPEMRVPIMQLVDACRARFFEHNGSQFVLEPFEGFRMPARQDHLFTVARTTKARPWQSAHQYGLAVDFACRAIDQVGRRAGWFWPENEAIWQFLAGKARAVDLDVPISWDRGHVEHPAWSKIKITLK